MTSIGRRPQNIKSGISKQPLIGSFLNFEFKLRWPNQNGIEIKTTSNGRLKIRGPNQNGILLEIKTTSNGRQPKNIKREISQQPLIRFPPNFKLKLMRPNQN